MDTARTIRFVTAMMMAGALAGGCATGGDKYHEEGKAVDLVKGARITIDQAIKTASENVPGTVVEAELEKKHGKTVWEVEVVGSDGKVTEVHIDAGSGHIIDTEAKKEHK
ncbi:MAG: PepSY domain-containing protein [Nitrospiraceae bacterium]